MSKIWDNQDDLIGHSLALWMGDQLAEPVTPILQPLGLPLVCFSLYRLCCVVSLQIRLQTFFTVR